MFLIAIGFILDIFHSDLFLTNKVSICSKKSCNFLKKKKPISFINRFDFMNQVEELETIEWGNPISFFFDSQIIFHRNTRRIRGEFNKDTGRMQNSL